MGAEIEKRLDDKNLVANDEASLKEFILDLASFTLDPVVDARAYAFHLDIALRRRIQLEPENWRTLCCLVRQNPISWREKELDNAEAVLTFTKSIIADIQNTPQDSWALILIKTSYLSTLDKSIVACENAVNQLSTNETSETQLLFQELFITQINYLDALRAMPFIIEATVNVLRHNRGYHFIPEKQAEVLTAVLECVNRYFDSHDELLSGLSFALKIMMPSLPLDDNTLSVLKDTLLPNIHRILKHQGQVSEHYQLLCNEKNPDTYFARITLFNLLGVRFDTLASLTQKTLIEPAQALSNAYLNSQNAIDTAINLYRTNNAIDGIVCISRAFSAFDALAPSAMMLDPTLLPDWVNHGLTYYDYLSEGIDEASTQIWQNLGIFYQGLTAYIPDSLYRFLSIESPLQTLITTHGENNGVSADTLLIHLQFLALMQQGQIPEAIWENCYPNYIRDIQKQNATIQLSYQDFLTFRDAYGHCTNDVVTSKQSLLSLLNALFDTSNQHKNMTCLQLVHRLKQIELMSDFYLDIDTDKIIPLCQELQAASIAAINIPSFKNHFFNPTVQATLLNIETKLLATFLEKYIDEPDAHVDFADYQKLYDAYIYIRAGKHLTPELLRGVHSCLTKCRDYRNAIPDTLHQSLIALTRQVPAAPPIETQEISLYCTPGQIIQCKIRDSLSVAATTFYTHFLPNLDKQIEACENLKAINPDNVELQTLCEDKIAYCRAIQALINTMLIEIRNNPYQVAKKIFDLASGQTITQTLNQSYLTLFSHFMKFVWFVIPSDTNNPEDTIINNLITYYLTDTAIEAVYRKQDKFSASYNAFNNHEIVSVFANVLGDPLDQASLLPEASRMLDNICHRMIPAEATTLETLKELVNFDEIDLIALCPYPILVKTALTVLKSAELQRQITPLYQNAKNKIGQAAKPYVAEVRTKIYGLLGVEIALTIEQQAFAFVNKFLNQEVSVNAEIQAFAEFYLKYKTLTLQTTNLTQKKQIIQLLFKTHLETLETDEEKSQCVDKIFQAFKRLDDIIPQEGLAPDTVFGYLVQRIDFSNEAQATSVYLIVLNQLIIKSLAQSAQLTPAERQLKFQQYAIALENFLSQLTRNPDADLSKLKPGIEQFVGQIKISVKTIACNEVIKLTSEITNRESLLKENLAKPFLGYTKAYVAFTHYERNIPKTLLNLLLFIIDASFTLLSWATIITTLLSGSGALQALLLVFGLTGAIGASASLYGAGILAAIVAVRFSIKFGKEIWQHRKDFNDIWYHKDHGLIKKGLLTTWVIAKSLVFAGLKTLFTDFIVNKISSLIGLSLINAIKEGFKRYPTEAAVSAEIQDITALKGALNNIENIDGLNLEALNALKQTLANATQQAGQIADLKTMKAIQGLIAQLETALKSSAHTLPVNPTAEEKIIAVMSADIVVIPQCQNTTNTKRLPNAYFNIEGYYQKTHPKAVIELAKELVVHTTNAVKQVIQTAGNQIIHYASELCRPLVSQFFAIIQQMTLYITSPKTAVGLLKDANLMIEANDAFKVLRQSMTPHKRAINHVETPSTSSTQPEEAPSSTTTSMTSSFRFFSAPPEEISPSEILRCVPAYSSQEED